MNLKLTYEFMKCFRLGKVMFAQPNLCDVKPYTENSRVKGFIKQQEQTRNVVNLQKKLTVACGIHVLCS